MDQQLSSLASAGSSSSALRRLSRVQSLDASATMLFSQLRLHDRRVQALAAAFRRETELTTVVAGADLARIDTGLARVATRITAALGDMESAFRNTLGGMTMLDQLLTRAGGLSDGRVGAHVQEVLQTLRVRHEQAHASLRDVVDDLLFSANNLAVVAGQSGNQSREHLRVMSRQMRMLATVTAEMSERLDGLVQNASAFLQDVVPAASGREAVLAALGVPEPVSGSSDLKVGTP